VALGLILALMVVEVTVGVIASSLAVLSDAAHMLTDAAALGLSLVAARLAARPAGGAMTYGLGRVEVLSAQINGLTLLLAAVAIVIGAVVRMVHAPVVHAGPVLVVAAVGVAVNLVVARVLRGEHAHEHEHEPGHEHGLAHDGRGLNVEGSYRHILTDLYGFALTAIAAVVILSTGFRRADAIASLVIAGLMVHAGTGLMRSSVRVFLEAAPAGLDPARIGQFLAEQTGVVQVHDLHVWEVTSGFPALSAHIVVHAGDDCHAVRRRLQRQLEDQFGVDHTTLQVDHEAAPQPPLQIEIGLSTESQSPNKLAS
jgi:cobalt-zinc-cadmium efflux system protein